MTRLSVPAFDVYTSAVVRAVGIASILLAAGSLHAQTEAPPTKLVPREPLASLRLSSAGEVRSLVPLVEELAPAWAPVGLLDLEGVDLEAPVYVFLTVRDGKPGVGALVTVTDAADFERSLLGAPGGFGFDLEGSHALIGSLPLPETGGDLPRHRPGDALTADAWPSRIIGAFRSDIDALLLEGTAQSRRLDAEARGEAYQYQPGPELGEILEQAASAQAAVLAAIEQCERLSARFSFATGLLLFDVELGFGKGTEIAAALDRQPLGKPTRILRLDPSLPYHQWTNLRLRESPTLRQLMALGLAAAQQIDLELANELVVDAERAMAFGTTFARTEVEMFDWPAAPVTTTDYRSRLGELYRSAPSAETGLRRGYEPDVLSSEALTVDRFVLSGDTDDPLGPLARIETYVAWTENAFIMRQVLGDAPEEGLTRVQAAAAREPAPARTLEGMLSSLPDELVWLARFDVAAWDRMVQADVPPEDRLPPLDSSPERPAILAHATAYSGTLAIGGWMNPVQTAAVGARQQELSSLAARYYDTGRRESGKEAFASYERAAKLGHLDAQVSLGWQYETGQGVEASIARAADWYRRAAVQGNTDAQAYLGHLYYYGRGGERDYESARLWYSLAAEGGHAEARYYMGWMYGNGQGVEKSEDEAFRWFSLAAEQGHAGSQMELAKCYHFARGAERDLDEAERWYLRSAEQGYAPAMGALGDLYLRWKKDADEQAVAWWRKGAEKENDYSRFHLARALENGWGAAKDPGAALALYEVLAEKDGYYRHEAEHRIGLIHDGGALGAESPEEAVPWFRKAADGGFAGAQLRLYGMYRFGRGVEKNEQEALTWLRRAAEQEDPHAMTTIGWHAMTGTGMEMDVEAGLEWWTAAAEKGSSQAQFWLGDAYEMGRVIPRDWVQAARWHRAAAEQGHAMSQVRLGSQYLAGNGVEKDVVESYAWLTLARESRNEQASALAEGVLMALTPQMTEAQVASGEKLAEERRKEN